MKTLVLAFSFLLMAAFAVPAMAQNASADPDYTKRLDLARQMHDIRPINMQADDLIKGMAERYPEDRREAFIARMTEVFDKQALTEISVKAMADTFTAAELQKMIDFHGSPEGKTIGQKMPVYQALVEPELVKRIDQAMMIVRTGKAAQ